MGTPSRPVTPVPIVHTLQVTTTDATSAYSTTYLFPLVVHQDTVVHKQHGPFLLKNGADREIRGAVKKF